MTLNLNIINNMKIKIGDIVLIIVIILLGFLIFAFQMQKISDKAEIFVDGKLYKTVDLNKNQQFEINNKYKNIVCVKDGKIFVLKSDCPDKTCVKSGKINKTSKIISCAPNGVVIKISGNKDASDISVG